MRVLLTSSSSRRPPHASFLNGQGQPASCAVQLVYFDGDMRVVQDASGEYFVYARAVAPRPIPNSDDL